ncbi:MAG: pantoate kinase [Candidatus Bathyarchaeia archaeon]
MRRAQGFSPAGISSFFEICDRGLDGTALIDPERIGARGGGFVIDKGVLTEVSVKESEEREVQVFINDEPAPQAETTKAVARMLLDRAGGAYEVRIRHRIEVPIGAGFGSSAAGAVSTALALSKALGISFTKNQIGRVAHVAEIRCKTGLGTVGPLMLGGCVITVEPGAPGYAVIDRISVSSDHKIIAGVFRSSPTRGFLASLKDRIIFEKWAKRTMNSILDNPSLENFMKASKKFAMRTGCATKRVRQLIKAAENAGAIGAAQNMVGEAVHAVAKVDGLEKVVRSFEKFLPSERVLIADIDHLGARLLG